MKVCKVCGQELPADYSENKCQNCLKKMYGAKIIVKLLKYIDPKIPFKKDDLISLNLPISKLWIIYGHYKNLI